MEDRDNGALPPANEKGAIDVLIRVSRLISTAAEPAGVLPLLAQAAVEHLGAAAAVVLQVTKDGVCVAAAHGLAEPLPALSIEDDADSAEQGEALLAACGGRFARAHTLPLVSGGDLFGALVLLFASDEDLAPGRAALAEGLVDLAATGLSRAAQYAELHRSYAELRASRAVLSRSHKLRALGQMAAGVSHDLKNILNPLTLHLQFLKRSLPKDAIDAHESVAEMQQVLKRGIETVERLRDFSRQSPQHKVEPTDLNQLVREAIEICRPRLRSRIDLNIQIVTELGSPDPVLIQASDGVAALVNLIVNAIDALGPKGTITVSTGGEDGQGWVRVADDGPGMPPEVEQRVFEPFFTTKGDEGTGLGLAMVYASVQRHGGRVTLQTAPGAGAAFTILLPSADAVE
ncbi:MAG: HAMP domain-containing sensor histidine kinase [Byssovorax sp.]